MQHVLNQTEKEKKKLRKISVVRLKEFDGYIDRLAGGRYNGVDISFAWFHHYTIWLEKRINNLEKEILCKQRRSKSTRK